MDLSTLSLTELINIEKQLPSEIKRREKEARNQTLKELQVVASAHGFRLDELIGDMQEKTLRAPVAVKYRHPKNGDLTWTGRGRQPKWVVEFLAAGGQIEQLNV